MNDIYPFTFKELLRDFGIVFGIIFAVIAFCFILDFIAKFFIAQLIVGAILAIVFIWETYQMKKLDLF